MLYKGSCHCGHIAFQVEGQIDGAMAAINVRCIEDIDLEKVPVTQVDGRSM